MVMKLKPATKIVTGFYFMLLFYNIFKSLDIG